MKVQIIKREKKRFNQLGAIEDKVLELKTFLKKSGRRFAQDARPWYVVLGEDAAATTWVKSLNLKPNWQSVGGSKAAKSEDVEVRVTEELVLLTAKNRFWQAVPADGERSLWQSFCHLLNKKRGFKAPHGLVVCVSIQSLKDKEQFGVFSEKLKHALNEAAEIYFGKIPIYLVLTDLDQVNGFADFSEKIRPEQKEQVFGFTQPFSKKNQLNELESLKEIHHQLETKLLAQLSYDKKQDKNADVFFFPQHLAALYPEIVELCEHITHASPNMHRLILRGVYFTATDMQNAQKSATLFSQPILSDVLLQESQAFSTWHQIDEWLNQHRKGILIGLSAGTIALLSIWWLGVLHDESYLTQINTAVMDIQDISNPLQQLIALQQLYGTGEAEDSWMGRFLGIMFPSKVSDETAAKYAHALQQNFEPMMAVSLSNGLANSLKGAKTSGISDMALLNQDVNIYNWLSAYLMLNELNHFDANTVGNMLQQAWQQDSLKDQKLSLYQDLVKFGLIKQEVNQSLISKARAILGSQPIDIRAFFALKANAKVKPVLLGGAQQQRFSFSSGSSIDGFYTVAASQKFLGDSEENTLRQTLEQSWVLGDQTTIKVDHASIAKLKKSVNAFYWSQYFATWQQTLTGTSFAAFAKMSDTINFLKQAGNQHSAFTILWQNMSQNLTGIDSGNIPQDKHLKAFAIAMNTYLGNQSNSHNITAALNQLGDVVSSANHGNGMIKLSGQILNRQVVPLNQLQQLADQAPQPIKNMLNNLIKSIVSSIFSQAETALKHEWSHSVAGKCRAVVGNSGSFVGASDHNVRLSNFANFFGPKGVGGQFVSQYLTNVVSIDAAGVQTRSVYGIPFKLPGNLQANMTRLLLIRSAFFSADANHPSFQLRLTPLFLSKNMAGFTIKDARHSLFYQNGPRISQTLTWPHGSDSVTVKFTGLNGATWRGTYPGKWGLIKFLNSASRVRVINATHYQLTFSEKGFSATYEASLEQGNFVGIRALKYFSCGR